MLNRIAIALSLGLALGGVSSASAANVHPLHHQARVVQRHIVAPTYGYDRYGPYRGYGAYGYDRYGPYRGYGAYGYGPAYGAYGYGAYGPYGGYSAYGYAPGAYPRGSAAYNAYAEDTLPRGEPTYMGVQDQFLHQSGSE
jgi:hypothetical protein